MKDSFEKILICLKRRPNPIVTNSFSEFVNKIFTDLLNKDKNITYSRYTSFGVVFADRSNRTIRDLLRRPVFEKGDSNWVDTLPTITKQYSRRNHSSTKIKPIQASSKKNEGFVYQILLVKRKKKNQSISKRSR